METKLNIAEMCHGALNEAVAAEIDNVMANIRDPNYPAKASRKITVTMEFKPDESRSMTGLFISTKATLATPKPLETTMLFERDEKGKLFTKEHMTVNNDNLTIPMQFATAGGKS